MADLIDDANELAEKHLEESLKAQQEASKPQREYVDGEDYACEDCGCPLPIARAKHGYGLCMDCKTWADSQIKYRKIRGEY